MKLVEGRDVLLLLSRDKINSKKTVGGSIQQLGKKILILVLFITGSKKSKNKKCIMEINSILKPKALILVWKSTKKSQ